MNFEKNKILFFFLAGHFVASTSVCFSGADSGFYVGGGCCFYTVKYS